jgi:hypothetical protein
MGDNESAPVYFQYRLLSDSWISIRVFTATTASNFEDLFITRNWTRISSNARRVAAYKDFFSCFVCMVHNLMHMFLCNIYQVYQVLHAHDPDQLHDNVKLFMLDA